MASWRKYQHRRYPSYNDNRFSTVPLWDKRYTESHSKVMKWDDYAVKQAVYDAKFRHCAEINGYGWDIPLPDPDMYIDDVDWDASVDPELCMDLEREEDARRKMIEKCVILESSLLLNQSLSALGLKPTGWEVDDEQVTKLPEPSYGADEINEANSWEENDSQRLIPEEHYNRRRKNNMAWSKNHAYQHGNNDYKMNRGKRNGGRGRRRGNNTYAAKVVHAQYQTGFLLLEDQNLDVRDVNEALLKAIGKESGEKGVRRA
ncbi:uncharacterized protein LOC131614885 [Vicia villosa]|uniref:uncharacterized protein LOC131614885 n=1 Tax=Vicia villosa TaxID=3911 RepID=UPI00273B6660|nr:uncharacterized protein LOC131614885 [Vicia villosa]